MVVAIDHAAVVGKLGDVDALLGTITGGTREGEADGDDGGADDSSRARFRHPLPTKYDDAASSSAIATLVRRGAITRAAREKQCEMLRWPPFRRLRNGNPLRRESSFRRPRPDT